jgi:hypothetical protein
MGQPSHTGKTEKIMNKTTTHKDSLDVCADLPLEDHELDIVSGGQRAAQGGQNDPAQMFQQILQQLTQGQG